MPLMQLFFQRNAVEAAIYSVNCSSLHYILHLKAFYDTIFPVKRP